jgi:hypothetical protein
MSAPDKTLPAVSATNAALLSVSRFCLSRLAQPPCVLAAPHCLIHIEYISQRPGGVGSTSSHLNSGGPVENMLFHIPDRHTHAFNFLALVSILGMCFADWQASRSYSRSSMSYPSTYRSRRDRLRPLTGMPLRSSELAFRR